MTSFLGYLRDALKSDLDREVGEAQGFLHNAYRQFCVDHPDLVKIIKIPVFLTVKNQINPGVEDWRERFQVCRHRYQGPAGRSLCQDRRSLHRFPQQWGRWGSGKIYSQKKNFTPYLFPHQDRKDADTSSTHRERGNTAYKSKRFREATDAYTEAAKAAPAGSEALSLAFANRWQKCSL